MVLSPGISVDLPLVKAVLKWTEVNIRGLEFLGSRRQLLTVHLGFVLNRSSSHAADQKDKCFVWTDAFENSFKTLEDFHMAHFSVCHKSSIWP